MNATSNPIERGVNLENFPAFSYAYQPIVDGLTREVFSYEALIRGPQGESAKDVLDRVGGSVKYQFDQASRIAAIQLAASLGLRTHINVNILPGSLFAADVSIDATLDAASRCGVSIDQLILEVTESEAIADHTKFAGLLNVYRGMGLKVAIDDFGAGISGLNLLADFQPDQIKIDMNLVRGIEGDGPRQAIVRAIMQVCFDLGIDVIAEGIETQSEYLWFSNQGVRLFQGYLFAKPGFQQFPSLRYAGLW
ncbi:EAL domain-containing protein [Aquabacterium sp.]|uniref:EAL domain-containing protein n=1 Tax=Aquabacterium sp. TaxID=1872578 RepID=UPI0035AF61E9